MSAPTAQLSLGFERAASGATVLARRCVRYPHHITAPLAGRDGTLLVVQSASGGLYGGEQLHQHITLGERAVAALQFPSATVVHAARTPQGVQQVTELQLAPQARLRYLQRPLILLPGARLTQRLHARLAPGAQLLWVEGMSVHDPSGAAGTAGTASAAGPAGSTGPRAFDNRVTITDTAGKPLVIDRFCIDDSVLQAAVPGVSGGFKAFGALWWLGAPPAAGWQPWRDAVRQLDAASGSTSVAASSLPHAAGLVVRVAALDGGSLDAALTAVLAMVDSA